MASHNFVSYIRKEHNFEVQVLGHSFISYVRNQNSFNITILGTVTLSWLTRLIIPFRMNAPHLSQLFSPRITLIVPTVLMNINNSLVLLLHALHADLVVPVVHFTQTLRSTIRDSLNLVVPKISTDVSEKFRQKETLSLVAPTATLAITDTVHTYRYLWEFDNLTLAITDASALSQMDYKII